MPNLDLSFHGIMPARGNWNDAKMAILFNPGSAPSAQGKAQLSQISRAVSSLTHSLTHSLTRREDVRAQRIFLLETLDRDSPMIALTVVALSLLPRHAPPLSLVVRPHRRAAIVLSEGESPSQPESIFTLDERKDGWDDVRSTIKGAIKERAGGIQELNAWSEKYVKPTTKLAKAIVEELPLPPVELPLQTATKAAAPKPAASKPAAEKAPPDSLKKQAFSFAAATLDAVAKKKAASPKPVASSSRGSSGKQVTPEAATVATANLLLLAGVPIGTLGVLYLLATGSF